jgi:hypothetical protein
MTGLSPEAFQTLVRTLARICDDPFSRVHSMPVTKDSLDRVAELGNTGFIEFSVDEEAALIRVHYLVWTG